MGGSSGGGERAGWAARLLDERRRGSLGGLMSLIKGGVVGLPACWMREPPLLPRGLPMTSTAALPLVFCSASRGM